MIPKFKKGDKVRISKERYEWALSKPEDKQTSWDENAIQLYGKTLTVIDCHTLIGVEVTGDERIIKGAWASDSLELCHEDISLPEDLFEL